MATNKPKLSDFNFGVINRYEIDIAQGRYKADGDEDHQRLLEALKLIQPKNQTPAPNVSRGGLPPPANGTKKVGLKLDELVQKFFLVNSKHSEPTKSAYRGTASEFATLLKNPNVTDVTKTDVTTYIEWLSTKKTNPRTIDNKTANLRSLINYAKKNGYFFDENPASGRNILTKKQKLNSDAPTWEYAQIKQFFGSENFRVLQKTDPDLYYICVLGVLTGVRVSALATIKKQDLQATQTGCKFIKIHKDKTAAGRREVPIDTELFNELLIFMGDREDLFRFTERADDGKGSSDAIRKRLNKIKTELGLKGLGLNFHGFRKFWNNWMLQNNIQFEARCQYVGHEIDHVNVATYGKPISTDRLGQIIIPVQKLLMAEIRALEN
jgi:integrase